ncbi:MAG: hypothetical protein ACO307_12425, partial [Ilumatobacteraceae bacterium]
MLDQISPEVGELDESAVREALDMDPDELLSLLARMTRATDVHLRRLAKSLAAQIFVDLARRFRLEDQTAALVTLAATTGTDAALAANPAAAPVEQG